MLDFSRSFFTALMLLLTSACGPLSQDGGDDSQVLGFGGAIRGDFGSLFRSPDVKPAQAILSGLQASIARARQSPAAKMMNYTAKAEFQSAVMREVIKNRGILSDQLHGALRTILASSDCDGAACARVFGIKPSEVDRTMDEMLSAAESSASLKAPEAGAAREAALSSLKRLSPDKTLARVREWFKSLKKPSSSDDGTCVIPALTAFGIRSNGPFPGYPSATQKLRGADFRNPKIDVKSQGTTNTCHTFAMTSLLAHSPHKDLAKAKNLDVERTAVAIWISQLGPDLESALRDEYDFLQHLLKTHETLRQKGSVSKNNLTDGLLRVQIYLAAKMYKQGGTSLDNFTYLQKVGGISKDARVPPLNFKKVEELTTELSKARHKYLYDCIDNQTPITQEGVEQALREPLLQVFDFAKMAHINPDPAVARELSLFEHVRVEVDKSDALKTAEEITADLKSHGPLYISANGHATTLVGYEKNRHVFWITDSRDKQGRPYIELAEEDLVRTIRSYSYLKKSLRK